MSITNAQNTHSKKLNQAALKAFRQAFRIALHTFGDLLGDVTKKLERSRDLLLQSANIAHFQEAQESRLTFTKEFEAQSEQRNGEQIRTVNEWLSPVFSHFDQEELREKRRGFPQTTRWLFDHVSMRTWMQGGEDHKPVFLISGIPGAGIIPRLGSSGTC